MRYGTPIWKRRPDPIRVFVTVEWPDGRVEVKLWQGRSVSAIKTAAREQYQGASLQFGKGW